MSVLHPISVLLTAAALLPGAPTTTPEAAGSRFGSLTSSVWRYGRTFVPHDLEPLAPTNPWPEPQPHRDRPERVTLSADGGRAYVTLPGTESEPGHELAVVDLRAAKVVGRIPVGARPYGCFLHPGGRWLLVTNELSNYLSVVDTQGDRLVGSIPLDYYAQGLAFSTDGRRAWVAIRYLDQVLALDLVPAPDGLTGRVREIGGFDEEAFFGRPTAGAAEAATLPELIADRAWVPEALREALEARTGGLHQTLRARCGSCHSEPTGGLEISEDPVASFLSAVDNALPGRPWDSPLVRAVVPSELGGYGDAERTPEHHTGGAIYAEDDPELARLVRWIRDAERGPGIPVGNPGSHPKDLTLSPDGRHLFVGNTGTMDVSIVDVEEEQEVGGIYLQNVAIHVRVLPDPERGRHQLLALTMGVGFGVPEARDPLGAETWDREHPAAQVAMLRDLETTDPLPFDEQPVLGPFDAVDGTAAFRMRDIQNDLVAVDLGTLQIPRWRPDRPLDYLVEASAYEAHPGGGPGRLSPSWVRYTSDTAEATAGDVKGDIAPELQRVPGSFPEWAAIDGDRLFVSMAGSFEVVEWIVDTSAPDPADRLTPIRTWPTGLRPVGVDVSEDWIVVANQLGETVTVLDRATGARRDVVVGDLERPALDTDLEKGELVAHTSVFSSDADTSCLHCHYRDTGDGRGWGASETIGQDRSGDITPGGTLGIPQMRNVFGIQPYYFEGTHRLSEGQGADIAEPASSIDFDRPIWAGDYTDLASPVPEEERWARHEELKERVEVHKLGSRGYDLDARREAFLQEQSQRWFGAAYGLREMYRFVAAFLGDRDHLVPNPYDRLDPAVVRGERIFHDPSVMCGVCHAPPHFTRKDELLAPNPRRALPPLTTITRRDAAYTLASVRAVERAKGGEHLDLDPEDMGRVEDVEGSVTTMQLRGLFDRPPVFLHHGRARSLREVLCTPRHPALRRYRYPILQGPEEVRPDRWEVGMNETTLRTPEGPLEEDAEILDTHGGTSHLSPREIADLLAFLQAVP